MKDSRTEGEVLPKQQPHQPPAARPIPLRNLLGELDPTSFKLHCADFNGKHEPIEVLATDWQEWIGWSRWRGKTDHFNRDFIFTMARVPKTISQWLFGGVFEVTGRSPIADARSYDLKLRDDILGEYIKRLVIDFVPTGRRRRLNLETFLDTMTVAAIRESPYAGMPFPGTDQIDQSFRELRTVVRQMRPDWRLPLAPLKGVYVIHDQMTGKPYVGAAYGDEGIWQRMSAYAETLHGGNVQLKKLVKSKGEAYALDNLRFALLEPMAQRTETQRVLDREVYWKKVLLARPHGLN